MLNVRLAGEIAVHLAVAGDVFDGVFICCPFSPRDVLDEIWDLIESVSEGFLSYSCIREQLVQFATCAHENCEEAMHLSSTFPCFSVLNISQLLHIG